MNLKSKQITNLNKHNKIKKKGNNKEKIEYQNCKIL